MLLRPGILACLCLIGLAAPARGQWLPSSPLVLAGGRLVIGGDLAAAVGERDDIGWFNYADYEQNALRLFRVGLSAEWRVAERLSFLGELRSENVDEPRAFAAYVRWRPFSRVPLDVQAGRIPPTFGAFGRRLYSNDNPLIGYPLAYQYLISIRGDAIPATPDDLLRMRARGWASSFPIGSTRPRPGVSIVSGFQWDTGVQVRVGNERTQAAFAVTNGTLSRPRVDDDNGGKQLAGRLQVRPVFGLVLGVSAARGAWLRRSVEALVAPGQDEAAQRALGVDAEYSRDHWIVRGETVRSTWDMPGVASPTEALDLTATSGWLEGRYRLTPRFYVAARADRLTFSRIRGTRFNGSPTPWDAPVSRIEAGGGWYLQRNLVVRAVVQRNWRDAGRQRRRTFVSGQILFWF